MSESTEYFLPSTVELTATDTRRAVISAVSVTPVAFADPPLLNSVGVHEPFALRAIVVIRTEDGTYGLGETYGDEAHVERLNKAGALLVGADAFNINQVSALVAESLREDSGLGGHGTGGMVTTTSLEDRVLSAFDVACLDIQGKVLGVPVSTLLGGAVRDEVAFSGYLFYKWAAHPGQAPDAWGEALDATGIVAQARKMIDEYGFTALKLKGGVFEPEIEAATIEALRQAFPEMPLRIDPNGVWTVDTAIRIGKRLDPVLEYLEDPCLSLEDNAAVRKEIDLPIATNMYVVSFNDVPPAIAAGAVNIVLSDHHFWGGLRRSQALAGIAETFKLGLSMHSNSHLGISFAAMIQLAAATKNIDYACDTHWPWKQSHDDVIMPGALEIIDGSVKVSTKPGLGVELDEEALARMHQQYLDCGLRKRDDTGYMQSIHPDFQLTTPRW